MWRFPAIFLCIHHKLWSLKLHIQTSGKLLFAAVRSFWVEVCCRWIGIGLDFRWIHGNSNSVLLGIASVPQEKQTQPGPLPREVGTCYLLAKSRAFWYLPHSLRSR